MQEKQSYKVSSSQQMFESSLFIASKDYMIAEKLFYTVTQKWKKN